MVESESCRKGIASLAHWPADAIKTIANVNKVENGAAAKRKTNITRDV